MTIETKSITSYELSLSLYSNCPLVSFGLFKTIHSAIVTKVIFYRILKEKWSIDGFEWRIDEVKGKYINIPEEPYIHVPERKKLFPLRVKKASDSELIQFVRLYLNPVLAAPASRSPSPPHANLAPRAQVVLSAMSEEPNKVLPIIVTPPEDPAPKPNP